MSARIHVSNVHKAIQSSVPYDLTNVVQSFYTFYSTLPLEDGEHIWSHEYTAQERFMTVEQIFKCLHSFTINIPERYAIRDRMIGYLTSYTKIPYDEIETSANLNFK